MSPIKTHEQAEELHTTPDPLAYLGDDIEARELFTDANNFIGIISNLLDAEHSAALEAANPHLWPVQRKTGNHKNRMLWHLGFVLALDELAKHPEALQQAVQTFRQRLAALLPPPYNVLDTLEPEAARAVLEVFGRIVEEK